MTQLSPGQAAGIEHIKGWYEAAVGDAMDPVREPFYLAGPAGTGKTTMARELPAALGGINVAYGTYTGKAAHVLRRKGCPADTIHSSIYMPTSSREARDKLDAARMELADVSESLGDMPGEAVCIGQRIDELEAEIEELERQVRRVHWELDPMCDWAMKDLIVLDEVSMVNSAMANDVESLGVPVLVLGDPAQLPPVEGGGHYTERTPDHLLTEIHRQALESPVLALATRIREAGGLSLGIRPDECEPASLRAALQHDQVLCWSNKRRWVLIDAMRKARGRTPGVAETGDKIMCLTNNKDLAVFNGQQFVVLGVTADSPLGPTLRVADDDGHERDVACYSDGFAGRERQDAAKSAGSGLKGRRMLATFADAITVHKAQGSEWESVYVVNETPGILWAEGKRGTRAEAAAMARRWMYTACSRASVKVTVTAAK